MSELNKEFLIFMFCIAGIVLTAFFAACQILKDAIDEGIAHHNEKPTAEIIKFPSKGDSNE